ncbi:MAG TPA: SDR family NAD(P)-dependent oxidoreductase [Rubrivivax sp.]|nr:SDR family NAD(P)-dependent oxidoreductase [Rubrivivax sp.]HPO18033.1 SDR family NAD(P)-dependent oxidoreductase [Rubrivivax sp.]
MEKDIMELQDKVAIVTGSGRGIGEGIARVLAREGAKLVIVDMNLDDANKVVDAIKAGGGQAIATRTDISKKAEADAMVAATIAAFGRVDVLVNNAGIEAAPCLLRDMPEAQWDRVLGINLKGTFLCCQAVLEPMMAQRSGRIVNIASTAALRMTFFGSADYTVSKHGVAGLTQHLAWEVADSHITVNSICPGGVLTPLMEQHTAPEFREMVTKRLIPLGRMCTIEEIGEAVSFLASDRAQMITGQMLAVDGGLMSGFGEDLRPIVRKRMADAQAAQHKG